MSTVRVACVQVNPGNDLARNLAVCSEMIGQAAARGADLVALPEFATFLDRSSRVMREAAAPEEDHPALAAMRETAVRNKVWLSVGSLVVKEGDLLVNRSYVLSPQGETVAFYDKIHMFDAVLPDGRTIRESQHYRPGSHTVVADLPFATLGLSICYDLRFPSLYRLLARQGANILMVPSAFTAATGRAHWQVLLQARAIETGCFVIAAATCGTHPGGWETFGHSLIVDPWGRVVAEASGAEPAIAFAEIDLAQVDHTRALLPTLGANPDFAPKRFQALGSTPSQQGAAA